MRISIIVPVFNNENQIKKCIESIINQKCNSEKEIVIVDGGSTDNTLSIIEEFRDYISTIISEKDEGIHDAINKGILFSTGDFIFVLASDDILLDNSFSQFEKTLKKDTDVWCGAIIVKKFGKYYYLKSNRNLDELYRYCSLRHPASFFSRRVFNRCGLYDKGLKIAGDRELFLRLYTNGILFQIEDIPITYFGMNGISNTNDNRRIEELNISLKYGMSKNKAEKLYNKKSFYGDSLIKKLLKRLRIFNILYGIKYKNNMLKNDDIKRLKLMDL